MTGTDVLPAAPLTSKKKQVRLGYRKSHTRIYGLANYNRQFPLGQVKTRLPARQQQQLQYRVKNRRVKC